MSAIAHLVAQTLRPPTPPEPKKSIYLSPALIARGIEIEELKRQGLSLSRIAGKLGLARGTVKGIWSKYQRI